MTSRASTLRLYKQILRAAQSFPSVKRLKLIEEIKVGFREHRHLTDVAEIEKQRAVAFDGLGKLSMYSSLSAKTDQWVVNMDKQPMPRSQ